MENKVLIKGKCYVVVVDYTCFEDSDNNWTEVINVYSNQYSAKKECVGLVMDELSSDMEFEEQFETKEFTLENIIKQLDDYGSIYLKQIIGNGKVCISIIEKEVK